MKKMRIGKNRIIILMCVIAMFLSNTSSVWVHASKTTIMAPKNLKIVSVMDTSVTLSWSQSNKGNPQYYNVYRNNMLIGNSAATTYTAEGLTPTVTYQFFVKAVDNSGSESGASNTLAVTTQSTVVTPTLAPTATPTPSIAPTQAPTATPTPSIAPTPSPTATPTPSIAPTPSPTTVPTPTLFPEGNAKKLVGYYAAWSAYSGFSPDQLDISKVTHINYAFANIGSDLKIMLGYPDVDPGNIQKLNALKQVNPNLKTLISVGGWSWSGRFSDAALTDQSRSAFADSCVAFIVQYNFDGVDIDWEYPVSGGLSTNISRPEDKQNYTLLMQKLREKLDIRGAIDGKQYLLTFAGAGTNGYSNNTELAKLSTLVDYANIMTYDIHGTWDKYADFNAPLYKNSDTSPQYKWSVDDGINTWIKAGFPAEKIVMGVPFYGYVYNAVGNVNNGLYQSYSGGSSSSYANIAANYLNQPGFTRYFHQESMVPWLFNGTTFISYEDEQSMGLKAKYVKTKGLGGAMVWELSQDPNRILLNALYENLK